MPKKIVTEKTMPIILHELDKWSGELDWTLFANRISQIVHQDIQWRGLHRYKNIVEAFNDTKRRLKNEKQEASEDVTLDAALREIQTLEAKNKRLNKEVNLLREQHVRWLENIRKMPNVDITKLNQQLNKPLPKLNRN